MWSKKASELDWVPAREGVSRAVYRDHPAGGRTYLVRLAAGTTSGAHRHGAEEEVLVLEGRVDIGGHVLVKGDFIYTEGGEVHDVQALEDALILVSTSKPIEFI
ncbi:ChrR Cupin-like domain-containing protein [Noviherbaspirillum humi]|uniref:ChrR Cupin-like domain-containing protein n=1 Tax=Noviherbaspirillum humi TaxID=1688639 RepID=A0A239C1W6_9BURK|nr:cupin domain-containing protein [Noviherbaspirillum humi]SNS14247.1 ChrR Cupin-like domain-containing protein [Noviherbaspirillum humi]